MPGDHVVLSSSGSSLPPPWLLPDIFAWNEAVSFLGLEDFLGDVGNNLGVVRVSDVVGAPSVGDAPGVVGAPSGGGPRGGEGAARDV